MNLKALVLVGIPVRGSKAVEELGESRGGRDVGGCEGDLGVGFELPRRSSRLDDMHLDMVAGGEAVVAVEVGVAGDLVVAVLHAIHVGVLVAVGGVGVLENVVGNKVGLGEIALRGEVALLAIGIVRVGHREAVIVAVQRW